MFSKIKSESEKKLTLPSPFIEKYMGSADGNFVKVYIMGLFSCETATPMNNAEIANRLMLLESDVIRAWKYWEQMGVVKINDNPDGTQNITFLDLSTPVQRINIETKPVYTTSEITDKMGCSADLSDVYKISESILEKPLSTNDMHVIYSLYDYYRMPLDVIPLLLSYCMKNGKKSMRTIERIAQDWTDKEINSYEKAEKYITYLDEISSKTYKLKSALGLGARNFTASEKKFVHMWLFQLNLSIDLVAFASDITVNATGKMSFAYMNKILQDWHSKGIKTPADAAKYRGEFKKKNTIKPAIGKPTGFSNFKQPDFDYDALEKRALGKK